MVRTTAAAIAVAGLALGAAACGPSASHTAGAKAKASAIASSSAGTTARNVITGCEKKITNSPIHPFKKFAQCVAGPGAPKATIKKIESCATAKALADHVLTSKSGRAKFEVTDLPNCVVASR